MSRMALDTLLSERQIKERIAQLAGDIQRHYANETATLILVGVLKGSLHYLSDLSRVLTLDHQIDFIQVSSYQGQKASSGIVQIRKDLDTNIEGCNVLIVEDIIDTGATLAHLRELLGTRKPNSIRTTSLLSKGEARKVQTPVEWIGFEIPNEFVVGYGLDYAEKFRNLPYVAILRE